MYRHCPVPTLDAVGLLDGPQYSDAFLLELRSALLHSGVFHLTNADVLFQSQAACLNDAVEAMKSFFSLPTAVKRRFERSHDRPAGFSDRELTKQCLDEKEVLDVAWVPHPDLPLDHASNCGIDGHNVFPDHDTQTKLLRFYASTVEQVCNRLLRSFCAALQMDFDAVRGATLNERQSIGFMRLNYYPRVAETMNIHEHTDAGLFTVLWASDVRGLEYEDRVTGEFARLKKLPDEKLTLTINVGDMFQVLTNGCVKAPKHRVICDPTLPDFELPRYSIALFMNPSESAIISPMCWLETNEKKNIYKDIPWKEFRQKRFEGDFADRGREIQISDYLI